VSEKKGPPKVDLVGQYISQILIPQHNQATSLYMQGSYVKAVEMYIRIIKTLYRTKKEDKDQIMEWANRFDTIKRKAYKEKGHAEVFTSWKITRKMNTLARDLYEELETEVWDYLHELGYFSMEDYGRFYDPSQANKSE